MNRRLTVVLAVVLMLGLGLAKAVSAQDSFPSTDSPDPQTVQASSSPLWKELGLDIQTQRGGLPTRLLTVLSEANLRALAEGQDPSQIVTMSGRTLRQELGFNALGGFTDEMVYTPVNPCRMIDTRNAGGAFAVGETRAYNLIGPTDYSSIGGSSTGCGIPTEVYGPVVSYNKVRALVLNVVAASATGLGNFMAWPTNGTEPTASIINFGTTQNIANGLLLKTCDAICIDLLAPFTCTDACSSGDLSFKANVSSVHLVVDVVGYMTGASIGSTSQASGTTIVSLSSGACTNATSVSMTNEANSSRTVICTAHANLRIQHTLGTQDNVFVNIGTAADACANDSTAAWTCIDNNMPTTAGTETRSASITQSFSLAANTSQIYYLNARAQSGASAGDDVYNYRLVCTIQP